MRMKSSTKTSIIMTVIITGVLGVLWLGWETVGKNTTVENKVTSQLTTVEQQYDLGTISMKDGLVDHTFTISNNTDRDVSVVAVATSCMCTEAYLQTGEDEKGPFGMEGMGYAPPVNEVLKAGERREMRVVYDPNAHGPAGVGDIDRAVYVTDDGGGVLVLGIKASVTP